MTGSSPRTLLSCLYAYKGYLLGCLEWKKYQKVIYNWSWKGDISTTIQWTKLDKYHCIAGCWVINLGIHHNLFCHIHVSWFVDVYMTDTICRRKKMQIKQQATFKIAVNRWKQKTMLKDNLPAWPRTGIFVDALIWETSLLLPLGMTRSMTSSSCTAYYEFRHIGRDIIFVTLLHAHL